MSVTEREQAEDARSVRLCGLHDLREGHALLASLVFLAVCSLISMAAPPGPAVQLALLLPAVAVGLPHGALDGRNGRAAFSSRYGRRWLLPFLGGYLGLFAATLILWWLAPTLALVAFLAISAAHFGQCDRELSSRFPFAAILAHGGLPIVLPALAFPGEVGHLFAWLVGERGAALILALLAGPVAVAWTAAVAVEIAQAIAEPHAGRDPGALRTAFGTAGACVLLFATVPPILAFGLYFALFHAPRALLQTIGEREAEPLQAIRRALREAAPLSLGALAVGVLLYALQPMDERAPAALRTVFLLLSALTVPHMWLELELNRALRSTAGGARARPGRKGQI